MDDLIDVIEVSKQSTLLKRSIWIAQYISCSYVTVLHAQGNRRYIKCLYVYNKIDVCRCCVLHVTTANVVARSCLHCTMVQLGGCPTCALWLPCSMEEVETIAKQPTSIPISCTQELNLDTLLEMLWEQMGLVRALLVLKKLSCLPPGALALYPHYGTCLGARHCAMNGIGIASAC